jgi:hypothetical protein
MLVEVAKIASHLLHLVAVAIDARIAQYEEPTLSVEVEGTCLVVVKEPLL